MNNLDVPQFPHFEPLTINQRDWITAFFSAYQPVTSELTFTNLFLWKEYTRVMVAQWENWLLIVMRENDGSYRGFIPIGQAPRIDAVKTFAQWLAHKNNEEQATFHRVDERMLKELSGFPQCSFEAVRAHFDYVYRTEDLAHLKGRKYHAKRNFLNRFKRNQDYQFIPFDASHKQGCLQLIEEWCHVKECNEEESLMGEWEGIRETMQYCEKLQFVGGVILIQGKIEAFSFAEMLNCNTAVVHIEKANPTITGVYATINKHMAELLSDQAQFINREQDLGDPGLRKAKLSYHPHHFVEKYSIIWRTR